MTMRTTTIPMAVKTPSGDRWELCSFCDQRWATRQYESVSRCGAHSETPLDALRRELDEVGAKYRRLRGAVSRLLDEVDWELGPCDVERAADALREMLGRARSRKP